MRPFLDIEELQATAHHIGILNEKIQTLVRLHDEAWEQLLTSAARRYATGDLGPLDMAEMFDAMRLTYGNGFTEIWNRCMPVGSGRVKYWRECLPNGPNGTWFGQAPPGANDPVPPNGVPVVYVLFAASNEPVYVGSTEVFRKRLAWHTRDKPGIRQWTAYRCTSREAAYQLEEQLLREHLLPLNRKVGC